MVTKATKRHLDRVASLGCLICERPAVIHHIRTGQGAGQRASDYLTIPLCPDHHTQGGSGVAIHAGQKTWEALYGSELDHLADTIRRLG